MRAYTAGHMDVVVFGKHVEVSSRLRTLTLEKVERITKFASDVRRVDVDYDEQRDASARRTRTRARSSSTSTSTS